MAFQIRSQITRDSESMPGVRYTVRQLNVIQRAEREFELLEHRERISELYRRYLEIRELQNRATEEQKHELARLDAQIAMLHSIHIKPAVIRSGLVSIEGLEVDGKPVTGAEDLLSVTSAEIDELIHEIWAACEAASGLSEQTLKNSQSPTTSPEVEAGA